MKTSMWVLPASMLLLSVSVYAAAKAEFKSLTFDCGTIIEGKTDLLQAEFLLTNTGDEVLKIISVRPGCGCTNIKYDSIIAPGKTISLKTDVNIKGYRSGPVSKSITFTSNSSVDPTVRLVIEAQIISPVSLNERYINLDQASKEKPHIVEVLSMKKELKVTGISFKADQSSDRNTWQKDVSMDIKYSLVPADTSRTDGLTVYSLQIFTPVVKGVHHGHFSIRTDNPDQKEIVVQGIIQG